MISIIIRGWAVTDCNCFQQMSSALGSGHQLIYKVAGDESEYYNSQSSGEGGKVGIKLQTSLSRTWQDQAGSVRQFNILNPAHNPVARLFSL